MRVRAALRLVVAAAGIFCAGCAGWARGPARPAPAGGVPVLAWHNFAEEAGARPGSLTESYAGFEAMLRFLRENGFRSSFPGQGGRGRRVVLTFDDGHRASALGAAAMMERYGFRGIFFIIPNRTRPGSDTFLSPDDAARLARAGHRVAAHGFDHRSMATSASEVAATLVRSARVTGESARTRPATADFAFPFGHYTAPVAEAAAERFRFLHTVNPGYWDGRSPMVPRMLIMSGVDPALFRDYVLGGAAYRPVLEPLFADGAVAQTVAFTSRGRPLPDSISVLAISADAEGRSYVPRPLGENARRSGDTVFVDLAAHMRRHHGPGRSVISYALVTHRDGQIRYLSPGLLNWIREPGAPE